MRIVHYMNQFFGGIGGEDKADFPLTVKDGPIGPGRFLQTKLTDVASIEATIICGDNTAQYSPKHIQEEIEKWIHAYQADVLIAGPAFASGRYGLACAEAAEGGRSAGIKTIVAMHPDNPGVSLCPASAVIVKSGDSAGDMAGSMERIAALLFRWANKESLTSKEQGYCVRRNIRCNVFSRRTGARRAVDMLLAKMKDESYVNEHAPPEFSWVDPAPPIASALAKIALITTGGLVPIGNPDRLEASSATKWLRYSIAGLASLEPEEFECIHAGIDTAHINHDPNRLVPLDICTELKTKGLIGSIDDEYYVTVGNLTPVARAEQFAIEMLDTLKERSVQAVMLTSS
jgi:glycine reductase